jgi:phospholipid-binding lipoprotein MlaA
MSRLDKEIDDRDPYEGYNRVVHNFNNAADEVVWAPVARAYGRVHPLIRDRLRDFLRNLRGPITLIHDIAQLDEQRAAETASRMLVNTTVGVAGLFDVATLTGIPYHEEDAGQTLAVYGVPPGPYVVLPIFGPSNARDWVGRLIDIFVDPVSYVLTVNKYYTELVTARAIEIIDFREQNLEVVDDLKANSLDYYIALKSLYQQNRRIQIGNGLAAPFEPDLDDIEGSMEEFVPLTDG